MRLDSTFPAAAIVVLALAACTPGCTSDLAGDVGRVVDETLAGDTHDLIGTVWRLRDLGGGGVLGGVEATLEFPEPGRVAGNGSCNRFFGDVEITDQSIEIGPLTATKKGCERLVLDQEASYFAALEGAERISVQGATLLIYYAGARDPLRFTRVEPLDR